MGATTCSTLGQLTNRQFKLPADGWFHIVPLGEYPVRSGDRELIQVVDRQGAQAMVANFNRSRQQPNFTGLLVDYDHFSDDLDKSIEAAGWLEEIENRASGVWGRIAFSDSGRAAIEGGRYRHVSPVFSMETCDKLGNNRLRPTQLVKVAVTNDPNMKGMVPLSNSRRSRSSARPSARNAPRLTARKWDQQVRDFANRAKISIARSSHLQRQLDPEGYSQAHGVPAPREDRVAAAAMVTSLLNRTDFETELKRLQSLVYPERACDLINRAQRSALSNRSRFADEMCKLINSPADTNRDGAISPGEDYRFHNPEQWNIAVEREPGLVSRGLFEMVDKFRHPKPNWGGRRLGRAGDLQTEHALNTLHNMAQQHAHKSPKQIWDLFAEQHPSLYVELVINHGETWK